MNSLRIQINNQKKPQTFNAASSKAGIVTSVKLKEKRSKLWFASSFSQLHLFEWISVQYYRLLDDTQGNSCFKILFSVRAYACINYGNVKGKFP